MPGAKVPGPTGRQSLPAFSDLRASPSHPTGTTPKRVITSGESPLTWECKVTSRDSRIRAAIAILEETPTFNAIMQELARLCHTHVDILVEFGQQDGILELGQCGGEISKDDISSDGIVDFKRSYRQSNIPDSAIDKMLGPWEFLFQGEQVRPGARAFKVRLVNQATLYDLAETIGHEIGAHIRGGLLGVPDDHAAWGTFAHGSAVEGSLARKLLDELHKHKGEHADTTKSQMTQKPKVELPKPDAVRPTNPVDLRGTTPPPPTTIEQKSSPGKAQDKDVVPGEWFSITRDEYDKAKALNSGRVEVKFTKDHNGTYYWERHIYRCNHP